MGQISSVDEAVLTDRLRDSLHRELGTTDRRAAMATLLDVHALHLAPIDELGGAEVWQHDPRVAALKRRLETTLPRPARCRSCTRPRRRSSATRCVDSPTTTWCRRSTTGSPRTRPSTNWSSSSRSKAVPTPTSTTSSRSARWGSGVCRSSRSARTTGTRWAAATSRRCTRSCTTGWPARSACARCRWSELPIEALERKALNGYLATNRALQPEMIGSLGMIECQAGPRCRRVVAAMRRLGVPDAALPFYAEHATADPHHGKDWLDAAVAPLVAGASRLGSAHPHRRVVARLRQPTVLRRHGTPVRPRTARRVTVLSCNFGPVDVEYDDGCADPAPLDAGAERTRRPAPRPRCRPVRCWSCTAAPATSARPLPRGADATWCSSTTTRRAATGRLGTPAATGCRRRSSAPTSTRLRWPPGAARSCWPIRRTCPPRDGALSRRPPPRDRRRRGRPRRGARCLPTAERVLRSGGVLLLQVRGPRQATLVEALTRACTPTLRVADVVVVSARHAPSSSSCATEPRL